MTPSDNAGKVLTRRIQAADGTTVLLHYQAPEAHRMRALVQSIRLKGDRKPSLSLIARRSMQLYLARLASAQANRPDLYTAEIAELEAMVTPVPQPALRSKKKAR